jgi:hypothetical protein
MLFSTLLSYTPQHTPPARPSPQTLTSKTTIAQATSPRLNPLQSIRPRQTAAGSRVKTGRESRRLIKNYRKPSRRPPRRKHPPTSAKKETILREKEKNPMLFYGQRRSLITKVLRSWRARSGLTDIRTVSFEHMSDLAPAPYNSWTALHSWLSAMHAGLPSRRRTTEISAGGLAPGAPGQCAVRLICTSEEKMHCVLNLKRPTPRIVEVRFTISSGYTGRMRCTREEFVVLRSRSVPHAAEKLC